MKMSCPYAIFARPRGSFARIRGRPVGLPAYTTKQTQTKPRNASITCLRCARCVSSKPEAGSPAKSARENGDPGTSDPARIVVRTASTIEANIRQGHCGADLCVAAAVLNGLLVIVLTVGPPDFFPALQAAQERERGVHQIIEWQDDRSGQIP